MANHQTNDSIPWIRSAFWTGRVKRGLEADFKTAVDDELIPALSRLPGVLAARSLWPERLEDNPPPIACQVIVEFANRDDVDTMLASPERHALRDRVREIAGMFEGAISHIDYVVGSSSERGIQQQ
jgi:antibiotic biosynthesis monooxygenase (ABM) superfamily enzyme